MFGALKRGRFRSMASLILIIVNVVGVLQRKRTLAASRGFLAAARLSCYFNWLPRTWCILMSTCSLIIVSFWPSSSALNTLQYTHCCVLCFECETVTCYSIDLCLVISFYLAFPCTNYLISVECHRIMSLSSTVLNMNLTVGAILSSHLIL